MDPILRDALVAIAQNRVKTASKWQVRQSRSLNRSIERWRHYEVELEQLRQALGELVSEQPA